MILLIENNRKDAELILDSLQGLMPADGIRHALDGNSAIEMIEHWNGEPLQLILLDADLDGGSGLDVLERLRTTRLTCHVPVVMLTSSDTGTDINRSYDLGANSVINKLGKDLDFGEAVGLVAPYWLNLNHPYIRPGTEA